MSHSIIVTGASGFIGSALCKKLNIHNSYNVIQLNKSNGFDFNNVNWIKNIKVDNVKTVIHLAQSNFYRDFPDKTNDMITVNIQATAQLLDWSRRHGVERFIFASTGNVYKPSTDKLNEKSYVEPISFYGSTKLACELLINQYKEFFQIINMRLFGVYGPFQKKMFIADIIEKVINENDIYLAKGIGLYITPVYIDDVVEIILDLAVNPIDREKNIINICSSEVVSYAEIVQKIGHILIKNPKVEIKDEEVKYFIGDNRLLLDLIGHYNFKTIDVGLKEMVAPYV